MGELFQFLFSILKEISLKFLISLIFSLILFKLNSLDFLYEFRNSEMMSFDIFLEI